MQTSLIIFIPAEDHRQLKIQMIQAVQFKIHISDKLYESCLEIDAHDGNDSVVIFLDRATFLFCTKFRRRTKHSDFERIGRQSYCFSDFIQKKFE